jgi:hypothetical protein
VDDRSKEEGHEMCKNLNPSGGQPLESRMRSKVQVRFGGSQTEKEQPCHLAGWLPYSKKSAHVGSTGSFSLLSPHQRDDVRARP